MAKQYKVWVEVDVEDTAELRSYAQARAVKSGMSESEFASGEHEGDDIDLNIEYWLGWSFDAGTPTGCGFSIQASGVEDQNEY